MYYFKEKGFINTAKTLELAIKRADELSLAQIVIASSSGRTAEALAALGPAQEIVCVAQQAGFSEPGTLAISPQTRNNLEDRGVKVLIATHGFAGIDRALRLKFGGVYPAEIIASTLRMFGQGVKVAVEASFMAMDAGLIPYGKPLISIGGTEKGADTAVILLPAHSQNFFDTEIKEIICIPGGVNN